MDGEIIDKETISKLASLPSLDTLRSKIIGSITSSASKIAGIVNKPGEQIAQDLNIDIPTTKIVIQGSGNVGLWTALFAYQKGFKIIGISDVNGGIFSENGLPFSAFS